MLEFPSLFHQFISLQSSLFSALLMIVRRFGEISLKILTQQLAKHMVNPKCKISHAIKKISVTIKTRCTQREQNTRLHVTSLSSDIKYFKEDNKIKPNM